LLSASPSNGLRQAVAATMADLVRDVRQGHRTHQDEDEGIGGSKALAARNDKAVVSRWLGPAHRLRRAVTKGPQHARTRPQKRSRATARSSRKTFQSDSGIPRSIDELLSRKDAIQARVNPRRRCNTASLAVDPSRAPRRAHRCGCRRMPASPAFLDRAGFRRLRRIAQGLP